MSNPNTRPTMDMVTSRIKEAFYVRMPSGNTIICELVLTNGHPVYGRASVVDLDNDDPDRGKKVAYDKAVAEVFEIIAHEMHQLMHEGKLASRHAELVAEHMDLQDGYPCIVGNEVVRGDAPEGPHYPIMYAQLREPRLMQGPSLLDALSQALGSGLQVKFLATSATGDICGFVEKPSLDNAGIWKSPGPSIDAGNVVDATGYADSLLDLEATK